MEDAKTLYKKAVDYAAIKEPNNDSKNIILSSNLNLAQVYLKQKKYDDCKKICTDVLQENP